MGNKVIPIRGFYFITDSTLSRQGNIKDVQDALECGVKIIQYRNKVASTRTLYEEALRLRRICQGVIFLINDRLDIALACDADGVHLGKDDLPCSVVRRFLGRDKIIGVTVRSLKEAKQAQDEGADYLGIGPIFVTRTKSDAARPLGLQVIRKIKKQVSLPIVAIGGINSSNAALVVEAGADAICAISAVVASKDVKKEITRFQGLFTG